MTLSRRSSVALIAASPLCLTANRLFAAKAEFWNSEDPEKWTAAQREQLATDSPWAKPTTGEVITQQPSASPGGGRHGGGGRSGRSASDPTAMSPKFPGVVRWVSAKPILLALRLHLPDDFDESYVIGVSGLPVISGHSSGTGGTDSFDALKELTSLQAKGNDAVQPGIIRQDPSDTSTLLFGFYNKFLDLSKAKTATFMTSIGPMNVKAKFDLSHMIYKGELAV